MIIEIDTKDEDFNEYDDKIITMKEDDKSNQKLIMERPDLNVDFNKLEKMLAGNAYYFYTRGGRQFGNLLIF